MAKFADTKGLSKQEKFIILGMLVESNSSAEDIAKYLERDIDLVNTFVETAQVNQQTQTNETQEVAIEKPQTQHIINKTGRGKSGVAIMTPAGSERSDENRKGRGVHTAKNAGYTHKIK